MTEEVVKQLHNIDVTLTLMVILMAARTLFGR
jgi:hypothetical protein